MTSKAQEREALAKIREIVDSLGAGSYIGTAFEGCFEIAEENINNDFGCSLKQQRDSLTEQNQKLTEELAKTKAQLDLAHETIAAERDRAEHWVHKHSEKRHELYEITLQLAEQQAVNATLENENIHLKAKLYDMITASNAE